MPLRTIEQIRAEFGHLLEPGYRFMELDEITARGDRRLNSEQEWGLSVCIGQDVQGLLRRTAVLAYASKSHNGELPCF